MREICCYAILSLWAAAVAARGVAAVVLLRRRVARHYPMLMTFLVVGFVQGCYLLAVWRLWGDDAYAAAWSASEVVSMALTAALVAEALWRVGQHFRNFGRFGSGMVGVFAALAFGAVVLTSGLGASLAPESPEVMLWARYVASGLLIVLLLMGAFARICPVVEMRKNVRAHLGIVALLLLCGMVGNAIGGPSADFWGNTVSVLILTAVPFLCCILWSVALVPAGEAFEPPPMPTPEELAKLDREIGAIREDARRALRILPHHG